MARDAGRGFIVSVIQKFLSNGPAPGVEKSSNKVEGPHPGNTKSNLFMHPRSVAVKEKGFRLLSF